MICSTCMKSIPPLHPWSAGGAIESASLVAVFCSLGLLVLIEAHPRNFVGVCVHSSTVPPSVSSLSVSCLAIYLAIFTAILPCTHPCNVSLANNINEVVCLPYG